MDDLDQSYIAQNNDRAAASAVEWLRSQAGGDQAAATGAGEAKPKEEAKGGGVLETAGKVVKDIAYGTAVEGVPQFVGGKTDAIKHTFMSLHDVGDWIDKNAPWLTGHSSYEEAMQDPRFAGRKEAADEAYKRLQDPNAMTLTSPATTITGNVIRKASEFMFGFKRAQAALGAAGVGGATGAVGAGALGSFFTTSPDEAGVANLVQSFPALQNPVTEYLANDPNDPAVYNRLRHAVENAGFGLLAEGISRGVKAFANHRAAVRAAQGAPPEQVAAAAQAAQAETQQAASLTEAVGGGPAAANAPLVQVVRPVEGSGTAVPHQTSPRWAPPATQFLPSQLSMRPEPSGSSTNRAIVPASPLAGPKTTLSGASDLGAIDSSTGRTIWQATDNYKALHDEANALVGPFKQAIDSIKLTTPGVENVSVRAKGLASLEDKVKAVGAPKTISDYLGGRIVVNGSQSATDTLDQLGQRFNVLNIDDKIATANPTGYRAIHAQVALENGMSAEVQIMPSEIAKVVENAHNIYDTVKRLPPTPENTQKIAAAAAQTKKIFDEAWAKQGWTTSAKASLAVGRAQEAGVPGTVLGKAINSADKAFDDMIASAGAPKGLGFNVNFARMGTENFDEVTNQMAVAFKDSINEARRGTITLAAQQRMADSLGLSVENMLARPVGQAANAENLIARSMLFRASRDELVKLAEKAAAPTASLADEVALRRQFMLHQSIQEQFLGARAEAGRALGALRIASQGGTAQYAQAIQDFWQQSGGSPAAKQLAAAIMDLERAGVPDGAFNAAVRRGWKAFSWDATKELFTLGLLWRPVTQIRNIVGNAAMIAQTDADYAAARFLGRLRGEPAVPGEIAAMVDGQLAGLKDAFRLAAKALRTGESQFGGPTTIDQPMHAMRAISAQRVAAEMGKSAAAADAFVNSGYGRAIDYIGNFVRLPGNALTAADDFFKQINFSGRVAAEAHSQAAREGLFGAAFAARRAELISNPPESLRMDAFNHANYATFHDKPGPWAQKALAARQEVQPLTFVMPFVTTPSQLFKVGMEHTPLAPLVRQWRADFAAGGAARDLALAKMATGSAMLAIMYDWAGAGLITGRGPNKKAEREALTRAGWQPNALQIGGKFYSVSGLGQIAPHLAFAGQIAEVMREKSLDPDAIDTVEEWTGHVGAALAAATVDQSFMQGFAMIASAMEEAGRGEEHAVANWLQRQAGGAVSMVPGMGLVNSTRMLTDPAYRDVNSYVDSLVNQIPIMRDRLPFERDLWGRVRTPPEIYGRVYNYAIPFKASDPKEAQPIDRAMADLGIGYERVGKSGSFDGVPMNFRDFPQAYEHYVEQAGNGLKHPAWGMGAMDFLNAVVSGQHPLSRHYENLSDGQYGGKAQFIKDTIKEYRGLAEQDLKAVAPTKFPDFAAKFEERRARFGEMKNTLTGVPFVNPAVPTPRVPQGRNGGGFTVPRTGDQ